MSKKQQETACLRKSSIGGQALIEGIMMRGPKKSAMAVRNPAGEIVLETFPTKGMAKSKIAKLPLIRGVVNFIASMKQGYSALMRSAEIAGLEDAVNEMKEEKEAKASESAEASGKAKKPKKEKKAKEKKETSTSLIMGIISVISVVLGVGLSLVLFIMLPTFIYQWCSAIMPFLKPENPALKSLIHSVFEGVLKILLLVGYMLIVSRMKDIRRTFQYHGAEHKTIFCYEHGKELTVENVREERRFHPRCGTSFLILMMLVGIFVGFFIDPVFIVLTGEPPVTWLRALIRLGLLPITMGIGYELIKLAGKHDNRLTRFISAPGLWMQRITVLEPSDDMIECAILAFTEVIPEEEKEVKSEESTEETAQETEESSSEETPTEE